MHEDWSWRKCWDSGGEWNVRCTETGPTDASQCCSCEDVEGRVESTLQSLASLFMLASGDSETEGAIKCSMPLSLPSAVLENCFSLTCFNKLRYNSHTIVFIHLKGTVQSFSMYSESFTTISTIKLQNTVITLKRTLYPLAAFPHS